MLLQANGKIRIVKDWTITEELITPKWFGPPKVVKYVNTLTLSDQEYHFKYQPTYRSTIGMVNNLIEDRNRYLALQRSLKEVGCAIVSKQFNDVK